jgi:RES domain-containing protein
VTPLPAALGGNELVVWRLDPGAGQQAYGNQLLSEHKFTAAPSAVSSHSWNLIFVAAAAAGAYDVRLQEPFALDTRLHPPVA